MASVVQHTAFNSLIGLSGAAAGTPVNAKTRKGINALHFAIQNGDFLHRLHIHASVLYFATAAALRSHERPLSTMWESCNCTAQVISRQWSCC